MGACGKFFHLYTPDAPKHSACSEDLCQLLNSWMNRRNYILFPLETKQEGMCSRYIVISGVHLEQFPEQPSDSQVKTKNVNKFTGKVENILEFLVINNACFSLFIFM